MFWNKNKTDRYNPVNPSFTFHGHVILMNFMLMVVLLGCGKDIVGMWSGVNGV